MKLLKILCIAAAALLAAAPAQAQDKVKLRVSTIPIIDTAPLQAAIAKGFFAEQGLEVDTTPTAGGAVGLPALAAGQVQITFSNIVSIVLGAKQGLGFQVIAAGAGTGDSPPDLAGIVVKKDSALKTGKDLEGKRLAVNTRNNVIWLYARAWVQATGGDPEKVTYLEVPFPQMTDALRGDRVDAAFVVEPFLSAGLNGGVSQLVGWPYFMTQKRIPIGMYAATESYIKANPGVIERFTRGYNKGVDWINQNKGSEEWLKIISGYTRMKPEQLKALNLPQYEKTIDPARAEQVLDLMRTHKMIEGAFDTKAMFYRTATQVVQ
ncbi:MAG TPA: ABC transporter substrate-binding protein [Burkholderiales bacterium]|nr:ABC transporter substrate-binding protein [Burkholderiales bacterium]